MTPKEKAKQLFDNMLKKMPHPDVTNANVYLISQKCALIAVDEILGDIDDSILHPQNKEAIEYWIEVKQEIEKL